MLEGGLIGGLMGVLSEGVDRVCYQRVLIGCIIRVCSKAAAASFSHVTPVPREFPRPTAARHGLAVALPQDRRTTRPLKKRQDQG